MSQQRVALITGSTSGIGLGIARKLKSDGFIVVLNGLETPDTVAHLSDELAALYIQADLTNPETIISMINTVVEKYQRLDILVNNAGIQYIASIEQFPLEKWNLILQLNLTAAFVASKQVIPVMKQQNWGRIINMASAHALVASPFKAAYVAAKHGLAGLTKVTALELANDGITCNAVCPGYVLTPLVEQQIPKVAAEKGMSVESTINEYFLGAQAKKDFISVAEVAATVSFLASESAASITGITLPVDGGWTAR
jgi:3-hydroxybutyrate dehydrogenase